jgi:hypothetical protein
LEGIVEKDKKEKSADLRTRRSVVSGIFKTVAGLGVLVTAATVAAPQVANACECGDHCCTGSPVVQ